MKYNQLTKHVAQHMCIFGDPMSGKSTLAAALAEAGFKIIWISLDNKHYDILSKLSPGARERLEIIVLPDTKEYPVAIKTAMKIVSGRLTKICDMHGEVDCSACLRVSNSFTPIELNALGFDTIVVWDHISGLAISAMNAIIKKAVGASKIGTDAEDEFKPGYDEYRVQGTLMDKFLTNTQQSRYHSICIAHSCETEMEDGKKKLVPHVGTVPFSRNVGKYFDHIIYCSVSNKRHTYGSSTTYLLNVITGSRTELAIEAQKDAPSLLPFFGKPGEGVEKKEMTLNGEEQVAGVLAITASVATTTSVNPTDRAPIPIEQAPAAGNVTSLHAAPPPTQQQPSMAMNPSAMAALERLRATKGK